ncbi:chaperonin containing t-complex protein 1, epsilon subunit, putative [Theileria equi strain WA]|uniref:T-complex protein 1 subunit epsilon n=1 Tax=Theileria equi strain WA TaxID=1537102 RepID=L0AW71_THEEQ|nr:chaperonin containing t-complex protein 1, epsilon subunit, putative [Theileria equi strain WA]AFZ79149.1 chaperonin containing t-complex protein 1, epsilon subunit, putative [Theileria equi strain WA]|eukprot:XP_004828815.1 chaperonin containing t-complex protein 1, epsilon subunit, putative [Theileria equi strain WA]
MNVAVDEFGKPFVILREQEKKRLTGLDAHKSNILAARAVADTLKTSLGPKGMDKIIVGPDGQVTITNDGATVLQKMEIEHQCAKLLVDLSKSQDEEVGDGTTGVVILAGALLDKALKFLDRGLHPLHIADGFEQACSIAISKLNEISQEGDIYKDDFKLLKQAAYTSLGSKVVSSCQDHLAQIAVDAVMAVVDRERKDVNLELIKMESKTGGRLEETSLIHGIVLNKDLSHSQMRKTTHDAKIAILTCPFEPPKPKTKNKIEIRDVESFKKLQECEQKYFRDMVDTVEKSGANFVICQWGFDDEANHLLMQRGIPAVRWVGGVEMELIAIATGGKIVGRFEDLTSDKLGHAKVVKEIATGTDHSEIVLIEGCANTKAVTVLVRGGNQMSVAETERCIHDAICCVRNLVRDSRVLAGGGAPEIAASIAVEEASFKFNTLEQYAIKGFAEALLSLPLALADNSGLNSFEFVTKARARQIKENNSSIGIDCVNLVIDDLSNTGIFESLHSKIQQISLATQVVKMILKIDDVIAPSEFN